MMFLRKKKLTGKMIIPDRKVTTGTFKANERTFDLVNEVLASGRISYGEKSMLFERKFAELHESKFAVLSNSGTSSLHVALQALKELHGWPDGAQVIVPACTFVATINVVLHNNMTPVFVDVERLTYGLDPQALEETLAKAANPYGDIVAIIPVHLYGQPCQMTEIMNLAAQYDLAIIEDSCEAMFVRHRGAMVGSMGQIGCFSTYNAHLITTGVGGIATTSDPGYASKMRSLVNHGLDISELNTDENFSPRPAVGRSFRFTHAGHSYRITELEAAIGLAQLENHRDMLRTRRRNARHLIASLRLINMTVYGDNLFHAPAIVEGNEHAWMMFPIVVDPDRIQKAHLTAYLNECDIETRDMMPIVSQPIYADMLDPADYPIAKHIDENGFYIGCHQGITPEDVEYVKQCLFDYIEQYVP